MQKQVKILKNPSVKECFNELSKMRVVEKPIFKEHMTKVPGFKRIFRPSDQVDINVVSEDYAVKQLDEVFMGTIKELDDMALDYHLKFLKLDSVDRHNRMKATFSLPGFTSLDLDDGSGSEATLELINSTDSSSRIIRRFGAMRLVCSNGMYVMDELFSTVRKHIGDFDIPPLEVDFNVLEAEYSKFSEMILASQKKRVTKEIQKVLIQTAKFPKTVIENLWNMHEKYKIEVDEPYHRQDIYAMYLLLTNWISNHVERKNIMRAHELERNLHNVMERSANGEF